MDKIKLKSVVEAILIASDRVLSVSQIEKLLFEQKDSAKEKTAEEHQAANDAENANKEQGEAEDAKEPSASATLKRDITEVLASLQEDYSGRAMELKEVASGFRFQVRQGYADYVGKLWEEKPAKYSRALLETLVLIAYRQPITRGEIEAIRGVSVSSHIVKTLVERDWVRVVGHRDVPGKPSIYGTTREFLDYFNLKSLDELPSLADIKDLDKLEPELALEETEKNKAESSSTDTSSSAQQQIAIRQARRTRRMRRQFAKIEESENEDTSTEATGQENESEQVEMS